MSDKKPKSQVDYGFGKPTQHCGNCGNMEHWGPIWQKAVGECSEVEGIVFGSDWCRLWRAVQTS